MSKVFVVQVPARRDGPRGGWVEKYDLSSAEAFGELVRLLPYGNVPKDPTATLRRLEEALAGFEADRDHLLLLGDPVACAMAVYVLTFCLQVDRVSVLKWDRRDERYEPYVIG